MMTWQSEVDRSKYPIQNLSDDDWDDEEVEDEDSWDDDDEEDDEDYDEDYDEEE